MCHMSGVTCDMSQVTLLKKYFFFFKVVELVVKNFFLYRCNVPEIQCIMYAVFLKILFSLFSFLHHLLKGYKDCFIVNRA